MAKWIQGSIIALLAIFVTGTFALAGGGASPQPQEGGEEAATAGYLGIAVANINERLVHRFSLTVDSGVVIVRVADDGPGGTAGLQVGDVIQAINGVAISTADQVVDTVRTTAPGTIITITILRDGASTDVPVEVGERPQPQTYKRPIPQYALRLITPNLLKHLLHADFELIDKDGEVFIVGLTLGAVKETTESGLLTITRKDGVDAQFQTATDTRVTIGRYPIKLVGFIEGTQVLVVEKDGKVAAVAGGLRELLKHPKPKAHKERPSHPAAAQPPGRAFPRNEMRKQLRELGPPREIRKHLRRLGPDMRDRLQEYDKFLQDPFPKPENRPDASTPPPAQNDDVIRV